MPHHFSARVTALKAVYALKLHAFSYIYMRWAYPHAGLAPSTKRAFFFWLFKFLFAIIYDAASFLIIDNLDRVAIKHNWLHPRIRADVDAEILF